MSSFVVNTKHTQKFDAISTPAAAPNQWESILFEATKPCSFGGIRWDFSLGCGRWTQSFPVIEYEEATWVIYIERDVDADLANWETISLTNGNLLIGVQNSEIIMASGNLMIDLRSEFDNDLVYGPYDLTVTGATQVPVGAPFGGSGAILTAAGGMIDNFDIHTANLGPGGGVGNLTFPRVGGNTVARDVQRVKSRRRLNTGETVRMILRFTNADVAVSSAAWFRGILEFIVFE